MTLRPSAGLGSRTIFRSFFTAKTSKDIEATHAHFHPGKTVCFDATLAFAERVPLAEAETVPLPDGLDASRGAARGISGVAAWIALAGTGPLRPGESVLVLGANGQVGRIAVQVARLLGARRVTGVVQHEAAREAPLRLGANTVVTSQDLPTLTERLLEPDERGYDVILDALWGPVIPAAVEAAARGARVVHLGNSAGARATLAGPTIRKNEVSILDRGQLHAL
jgi:NADPH:quinone reductase-like Zn-dependent oxidoreductase